MRKVNQGFSLLEAIVALVILSAGLLAAFAWFDQGIKALIKVDNLALEESVLQETLVRLQLEDFSKQREGSYRWKNYQTDWVARLVEPTKLGKSRLGSQGYFDLSFYRVSLKLAYSGREIANTDIYLLKEQLVRRPPEGF